MNQQQKLWEVQGVDYSSQFFLVNMFLIVFLLEKMC